MKKIRVCFIFYSPLQLSVQFDLLHKITVWHILILHSATLLKSNTRRVPIKS